MKRSAIDGQPPIAASSTRICPGVSPRRDLFGAIKRGNERKRTLGETSVQDPMRRQALSERMSEIGVDTGGQRSVFLIQEMMKWMLSEIPMFEISKGNLNRRREVEIDTVKERKKNFSDVVHHASAVDMITGGMYREKSRRSTFGISDAGDTSDIVSEMSGKAISIDGKYLVRFGLKKTRCRVASSESIEECVFGVIRKSRIYTVRRARNGGKSSQFGHLESGDGWNMNSARSATHVPRKIDIAARIAIGISRFEETKS